MVHVARQRAYVRALYWLPCLLMPYIVWNACALGQCFQSSGKESTGFALDLLEDRGDSELFSTGQAQRYLARSSYARVFNFLGGKYLITRHDICLKLAPVLDSVEEVEAISEAAPQRQHTLKTEMLVCLGGTLGIKTRCRI